MTALTDGDPIRSKHVSSCLLKLKFLNFNLLM